LVNPHIPHGYPICKGEDHQGVVYLTPVEEVKASDRVAEKVDALDC